MEISTTLDKILKQNLIYGIFIQDKLIYVGKSDNIKNRIIHHTYNMQYNSINKDLLLYKAMYLELLNDRFPIFKILALDTNKVLELDYIKVNNNLLNITGNKYQNEYKLKYSNTIQSDWIHDEKFFYDYYIMCIKQIELQACLIYDDAVKYFESLNVVHPKYKIFKNVIRLENKNIEKQLSEIYDKNYCKGINHYL